MMKAFARNSRSLRHRWSAFFSCRCLAGFPWFWPAKRGRQHVMAEARRIVRQQFGRDHHPVCRVLAKVFTAIAWPPAVLIHIWKIRRDRGSEEVQLTRMPAAFWTALRHNVLPGEYYAYALWLPERKKNIDKYLYSNECPRLFKALNSFQVMA